MGLMEKSDYLLAMLLYSDDIAQYNSMNSFSQYQIMDQYQNPYNLSEEIQSEPNPNNSTADLEFEDPLDSQLNLIRNRIASEQQQQRPPVLQNIRNMKVDCSNNSEPNCIEQCADLVFLIYVIYVYFTSEFQHKSFVWVWIVSIGFACCRCRCMKIILNLVLLFWAIILMFSGTSTSQTTLYFFLHITDICVLGCLCCCLQITALTVIGLLIYAFFLGIKVRVQKYLRYRKNRSTIDQICEVVRNQPEESQNSCSICFQADGNFCQTECQHRFHSQCLKQWLRQHINCPLCRKVLY